MSFHRHENALCGVWVEFECPRCVVDMDLEPDDVPAEGEPYTCLNCGHVVAVAVAEGIRD